MKLECPTQMARKVSPWCYLETTFWREAENWYVDRVALYTVPRSASPPDCYIIIQVMAERSPSPSQKRSTSNVFLTGSLPQTARAYSEYVYFEYAPLR